MVKGLSNATRVVFDDERVVANAGVVLPAVLADPYRRRQQRDVEPVKEPGMKRVASSASLTASRISTAILRGGPANGNVLGIEPGQKTITLRGIYHAGAGSPETTPTYGATDEMSEDHVVFAYQPDKRAI